jgi:hypothetical protein
MMLSGGFQDNPAPDPVGNSRDEWQTSSRWVMVEAFAQIDQNEIDPILRITKKRPIMPSAHHEITPD